MKITVPEKWNNLTAGEFLKKELACSQGVISALKHRDDGILLNGRHVTVRAVLHVGDTLCLAIEDTRDEVNPEVVPTSMPLEIIYEDEDIIAVNKPFGMPTHPSLGHYDDTLANGLAAYFRNSDTPFVFRALNRLDRNTSGVVVVAKNRLASSRLSSVLQSRQVKKNYLAVTDGVPDSDRGIIEADIKRREESIITRMALPANSGAEGAQSAVTEYKVINRMPDRCAVLVRPLTGRTHQIRVHFSYIGTPLLGDDLYGKASSFISHQALHALALQIPLSDKTLEFFAPPPEIITELSGLTHEQIKAELANY